MRNSLNRRVALVALCAGALLLASPQGRTHGGEFPDHWIDGTDPDEPTHQVHEFTKGTWIIRQSLRTHFEAPFVYLLAGAEQALLLDTGATDALWLRVLVDELIGETSPLIVAHSHAHSDHVAGDVAFDSRANTRIVGHKARDVAQFFGIRNWP